MFQVPTAKAARQFKKLIFQYCPFFIYSLINDLEIKMVEESIEIVQNYFRRKETKPERRLLLE